MATAAKACQACRQPAALFPFTMAFQPIVDTLAQRIVAHEALVRGPNREGAAIVLAQMDSTNIYAFDNACRVKAIELASSLGLQHRLNINFLPRAVYEPRACIRATLEAAKRTGFDPTRLTFEITENEDLADIDHLRAIMAEYRRQGFKVALDDVGTGYSGLARIAELCPDVIKLDRALIKGCDTDSVRLAIVAAMIRLGDDTGMQVVLEGMERQPEVDALRSVGGRFMQGFYFSRPVFEGLTTEADLAAGALIH
jgi:EAL domain-containing protein (putative c-di-GMP-specific phosphodiesterase class I)